MRENPAEKPFRLFFLLWYFLNTISIQIFRHQETLLEFVSNAHEKIARNRGCERKLPPNNDFIPRLMCCTIGKRKTRLSGSNRPPNAALIIITISQSSTQELVGHLGCLPLT